MNKRKDWQAGLGIKSHKPFCQRPPDGLSCPSSGHFGTKPWALRDQALGIDRPSDGHSLPMRCAQSAQTLGVILGTPYRSAALLLCMIPHDYLVVIEWRFNDISIRLMILLWYFYDTSCKIIPNISFFYLIICQLFISIFSWQNDTLILFS